MRGSKAAAVAVADSLVRIGDTNEGLGIATAAGVATVIDSTTAGVVTLVAAAAGGVSVATGEVTAAAAAAGFFFIIEMRAARFIFSKASCFSSGVPEAAISPISTSAVAAEDEAGGSGVGMETSLDRSGDKRRAIRVHEEIRR